MKFLGGRERERERERERDGEEVDSKFKREEMESLKNEGAGQWVTKDVFVWKWNRVNGKL